MSRLNPTQKTQALRASQGADRATHRPPPADAPPPESNNPRASSANATADRAIEILLLFSLEKPVWTTSEISERFGMPRSTAHRYIGSLRACSLLVENKSGGWCLGPRLFPLARAAKATNSIVTVAAPFLQALNGEFGEAVALYERSSHETIELDRYEAQHRVRLLFSRGQMLPWPGAASAKVLLAYASPEEQAELIACMVPVRYTERTISSIPALRRALEKIVRDGHAYSDQERDAGVRAIAAPIFSNRYGRYCVTMSGPVFRITDAELPKMIASVKSTAVRVSEALCSIEG